MLNTHLEAIDFSANKNTDISKQHTGHQKTSYFEQLLNSHHTPFYDDTHKDPSYQHSTSGEHAFSTLSASYPINVLIQLKPLYDNGSPTKSKRKQKDNQ